MLDLYSHKVIHKYPVRSFLKIISWDSKSLSHNPPSFPCVPFSQSSFSLNIIHWNLSYSYSICSALHINACSVYSRSYRCSRLFPSQPVHVELLPLSSFIVAPETDLLPLYEAVKSRTFINISLTELNCEARGHAATFYTGSDIIVYMDFGQLLSR